MQPVQKPRSVCMRAPGDQREPAWAQSRRQARYESLDAIDAAPGKIERVSRLALEERRIEDHEVERLPFDRAEQVAFQDSDPVLHLIEQYVCTRAQHGMRTDIRCCDGKAARCGKNGLNAATGSEIEGPRSAVGWSQARVIRDVLGKHSPGSKRRRVEDIRQHDERPVSDVFENRAAQAPPPDHAQGPKAQLIEPAAAVSAVIVHDHGVIRARPTGLVR